MLLAAPLVLLIPPRPSFQPWLPTAAVALWKERAKRSLSSPRSSSTSLTDWVRLLRSQPDPSFTGAIRCALAVL